MLRKIVFLGCLLTTVSMLGNCAATKSADVFTEEKISGPKIIAMQGARASWVYEIERRLKKRGFQIKRVASQNMAIQRTSPNKTIAYNEATARYLLVVDGYANDRAEFRCLGGGYDFSYLDVELVDIVKNETIVHYSNSGYSENCPPMSKMIFTDIENLISSAWK